MHILGLGNGKKGGNSEILLKAALLAAKEADSSTTISCIHIPSVHIATNPQPLSDVQDISMGTNTWMRNKKTMEESDDRRALLNAILDSDGLVFATPIYSHQPAGTLKGVLDHILGPFTDAAFARLALSNQESGHPDFAGMKIDTRLLKPRVAAFIAVGGSTASDQSTMALPSLHILVYPLHAKVIDQVIFQGYGSPGAVLASGHGDPIGRARVLGRRLASQLGKPFDEAQYLGPSPRGACPYCHLSKLGLSADESNEIECITCGARGRFVVRTDGVVGTSWDEDCSISSITLTGKLTHIADIAATGAVEVKRMRETADLEKRRKFWENVQIPQTELPSLHPASLESP